MSISPQPSMLKPRIPAGVWVLGFVSLLMDVSSEIVHSLLPVFLTTVLGASVIAVGIVEGVGESLALMVKVFSGMLSDWLGKRKGLAIAGYSLGTISKPLFALATSTSWILGARVIDRIGKGIRGAPRDALIADITPPEIRGAAFGLRQSLDTVGAFLGPVLAIVLMWLFANDLRAVFWVAFIPGVFAVLLLWWGIREPASTSSRPSTNPIRRENLRRLSRAYWQVVMIGGVFTLARFSEAFLVLRAHEGGLDLALVPLVLIAMNIVYAASAYPFGVLADRASHTQLLTLGLIILIASNLALASDNHGAWFWIGVALWGLHMGVTQGLLATMIANTAPGNLRGTAFGFFNLISGIALLCASVMAGLLWDSFGASVTFITSAALSVVALFGLLWRGLCTRRT